LLFLDAVLLANCPFEVNLFHESFFKDAPGPYLVNAGV
jgi:hypothetical protein